MRQLHLDLLVVMILANLVLIVNLLGIEAVWLRALLSLPLAFLGVGYTVSVVLFPARRLGVPERLLLSLGLSLGILILSGLLLHVLPVGLTTSGWTSALALTSAAAVLAGFALRRRAGWPKGDLILDVDTLTAWFNRAGRAARPGFTPNLRLLGGLGLAAILALTSLGLAFRPAPQDAFQGYTLLWLAPGSGESSGYAQLGVRSMEFEEQRYRVDLYAGGELVQQWQAILLEPTQTWVITLDLADYPSGAGPLEAHLYREGWPGAPYRQVRLWPGQTTTSQSLEGQ